MPRDRQRVMLESGPKLDLRRLRLKANARSSWVWTYTSGLIVTISVELGELWGTLILEHGSKRQTVHMEGLPRPYGGVQWYATCPTTGRRALVLWKPPGSPIFASRHAWGRQVAYAVQFEDATARAWSAKRRVVRRLGGRDPDDYTLPRRPRGMRRPTYNRLTARYWAAEERLDEMIVDVMDRIMRRYGKTDFAA